MTINSALESGASELSRSGVPDAYVDAALLMCHVLGVSRAELPLRRMSGLTDADERRFFAYIKARASRKPLQYIIGSQGFYGRDFITDARALIPRPETETLCERAVEILRGLPSPDVLDLCTGSGAIAVTIKLECPQARVCASDISADALGLARENAQRLGADVEFLRGDMLEAASGREFDMIVSNPPYVARGLLSALQPELRGEPRMALDGGEDGLDFYRRIALDAPGCLRPGGMLLMELGDGQGGNVASLLEGRFTDIRMFNDMAGRPRVISASLSRSSKGY